MPICTNCLVQRPGEICTDCINARVLLLSSKHYNNDIPLEEYIQNQNFKSSSIFQLDLYQARSQLQALKKKVLEKKALLEEVKELSLAIGLPLLKDFDLKALRKNKAIAEASTKNKFFGVNSFLKFVSVNSKEDNLDTCLKVLGYIWVDDIPWIDLNATLDISIEECNSMLSAVTCCTNLFYDYMDFRLPFQIIHTNNKYYITSNWTKGRLKYPLYIEESYANMAEFIVGLAMFICNNTYVNNRVGIKIEQNSLGSIVKNLQKLLSVFINTSYKPRSRFSFLADFNVLINQAARVVYKDNWNHQISSLGVYRILLEDSIWKDVDCSFIDDSWDFV
ncbi:hypothetical protein BB561_001838 [Smittium simulii]|uniref:Uncharacterized protein n=1 Tax=Smittium simulii TaxID=133385 RepID=A0A2T9YST8_9FUNG|nr:hypothetical protein BB561_001838 [Smittium simulii]